MTFEEKQLIEAAQANKTTFVELYDLNFEKIHRFIRSRVSDQELAQDLTSETFIKALENINKYTYTGKPFSAWLYRIAINNINEHFRKNKKQHEIMERKWQEIGDKFDSADLGLKNEEEAQAQLAQIKDLNQSLQKLKPHEHDIITLKYYEDLSYKEIAETLNITISNVGVKLTRALNKLSQLCNATSTS